MFNFFNSFIGSAQRENTMHMYKIWTWGYFCSFITQHGDDKCSQNENFHMDVIFHVWVDVTLNTLGFQVVERCRFLITIIEAERIFFFNQTLYYWN